MTQSTLPDTKPSPDVLKHVVDVHCHPTDSDISEADIESLPITICAMATRQSDQELVAALARSHPDKVIPCFGYHPWFTHWIFTAPGDPPPKQEHYRAIFSEQLSGGSQELEDDFARVLLSLPDPIPLHTCLDDLQAHFQEFPRAMLGEVGIDRSARVPFDYREEERELSQFTVPFDHQITVLEAQLDLAVKFKRNASIHSVKSPKPTVDLLDRMQSTYGKDWSRISVDLHSCGLSPDLWRSIEKKHSNVFLSLSTVINSRSPNYRRLIETASPLRILAESDIHQVQQCAELTWNMLRSISEVKNWTLEESWSENGDENMWGTVRRLEENWKLFERGDHEPPKEKKVKKLVVQAVHDPTSE